MYRSGWSNQRENPPERRSPERQEAGLREEQPTPPPADSPQRHNSALSNAGCSSGAGASDVATFWCSRCETETEQPQAAAYARAGVPYGVAEALSWHRAFVCPLPSSVAAYVGSLRERYAAMPSAPWFRKAHEGKSLGTAVGIDE